MNSPQSSPVRKGPGLFVAVVIAAAAAAGVAYHRPPAPLPENAPATEFSAVRAHKHLEAFIDGPHCAGTEANDKVRDYIARTLKDMGVETRVDDALHVSGGHDRITNPRNVMARIPGTANTKAFMLAAHFDSVPFGPGASDDCGGVAAMLEVCRALKAGPPLKNDILFVFTDGEECGSGAPEMFLKTDWGKNCGLMLNFEARGTSGVSYLFETSEDNGWIVSEIAKCAPYPIMSSLMFDVYHRTPFGSDFDRFKHTVPGMNVAYVDRFYYYHTHNDSPEKINLASLQHHGSYGLAFARHFGNMPLDAIPEKENAVYFNPFGSWLVHYPGALAPLFAFVPLVLLVLVLRHALARGSLSLGEVLNGGAWYAGLFFLVPAIMALLLVLTVACRGLSAVYGTSYYEAAYVLFTAALLYLLHARLSPKLGYVNMAFGALLVWTGLLLLTAFFLKAWSFLIAWPMAFALLGFWVALRKPNSWTAALALAVTAVPGILIMAPLLHAVFVLTTAFGGPILMIFIVLTYGVLIPHFEVLASGNHRWFPALCAGLGALLVVAGIASSARSKEHPHMDFVTYVLDKDAGKASWVTTDKKNDEFTAQFFGPETRRGKLPEFDYRDTYRLAPAPVVGQPEPVARLVGESVRDGLRTLDLHISSPRLAARIKMFSETPVKFLTVDGKEMGAKWINDDDGERRKKDPNGRSWKFEYDLFPHRGADVTVTLEADKEFKITLIDYRYELPATPEKPWNPRPPYLVCQSNIANLGSSFQSDQTIIRKTYVFPPR